jgi:uncharacterized membrane-anchored protein
MKKIFLIGFIVLSLIQLGIPAKMMFDSENAIAKGKEYKFRTAPVDPYDPFRGRYVTLSFDAENYTAPADSFATGDIVYVQLKPDSAGYAIIDRVLRSEPSDLSKDYVKAHIDWAYSDQVRIEYPFRKFYMEEAKAQGAEKVYREANRRSSGQTAWALVSVYKGQGVLKDVFVDGVSIKEMESKR